MSITTNQNLSRILRIIIACIYVQTLYFKFSAHPDSVYIFSKIGMEPYGRIGLGVVELLTAVLLLIPSTKTWGALVSLSIISGAIFLHLGPIGIEVQGDSGKVFYLALLVFLCSLAVAFIHRQEVQNLWHRFFAKKDVS